MVPNPDRLSILHHHLSGRMAEVDARSERFDPRREAVGDHLAAAPRIPRAAEVVVREPGVEHQAHAAGRQAVVAVLAGDHRAQAGVARAGVEEVRDGGLAVPGGEAAVQERIDRLGPAARCAIPPEVTHLATQADVSIDTRPFRWKHLHEAVAVSIDARRDREAEVGEDQLVEPILVEGAPVDRNAHLVEHPAHLPAGAALADVVEAHVEPVPGVAAPAGEHRGAAARDVVLVEHHDASALLCEAGGGHQSAETGPDDHDVGALRHLRAHTAGGRFDRQVGGVVVHAGTSVPERHSSRRRTSKCTRPSALRPDVNVARPGRGRGAKKLAWSVQAPGTSPSSSATMRARVHHPCTIGRLNPNSRAVSGQRCTGFWSPLTAA
jgi:hypothetical protein